MDKKTTVIIMVFIVVIAAALAVLSLGRASVITECFESETTGDVMCATLEPQMSLSVLIYPNQGFYPDDEVNINERFRTGVTLDDWVQDICLAVGSGKVIVLDKDNNQEDSWDFGSMVRGRDCASLHDFKFSVAFTPRVAGAHRINVLMKNDVYPYGAVYNEYKSYTVLDVVECPDDVVGDWTVTKTLTSGSSIAGKQYTKTSTVYSDTCAASTVKEYKTVCNSGYRISGGSGSTSDSLDSCVKKLVPLPPDDDDDTPPQPDDNVAPPPPDDDVAPPQPNAFARFWQSIIDFFRRLFS